MVDFDRLVNATCVRVFGEQTSSGAKVCYRVPGGPSFDLDGIFDEAWSQINFQGSHGSLAPISTTKPRFGVRLADFPAGVSPAKKHTFTRANGEQYEVVDVQPDGFGYTYLTLKRMN
jgi:hypothetical protein